MEISRENIFPARRSCVRRTRNSGSVSANIADDTIRHRGERMLHAQLEALSRQAAQEPMVWSFAAQLGKRWQHFAALKNYSDSVHRCEPACFIHIFHDPALCDDHGTSFCFCSFALHPHEAEPAKIAA